MGTAEFVGRRLGRVHFSNTPPSQEKLLHTPREAHTGREESREGSLQEGPLPDAYNSTIPFLLTHPKEAPKYGRIKLLTQR